MGDTLRVGLRVQMRQTPEGPGRVYEGPPTELLVKEDGTWLRMRCGRWDRLVRLESVASVELVAGDG